MQLNQKLSDQHVRAVLETMLIDKPVKILRTIATIGRSKVSWLHMECEITGKRRATFISFANFEEAFWDWVEMVEVMALAFWQRVVISNAIFDRINIGDRIFHPKLGWGKVVEKDRSINDNAPRFWLGVDDTLQIIEPCSIINRNAPNNINR